MPLLLSAQISGGTIRGVVTDSTGALLPGAQIHVKSVLTGVETSYVSSSEGVYVSATLPVGPYTVTAAKEGFRTEVFGPVAVEMNQTTSVPLVLRPGTVTEQVVVAAGAAQLIQSETSGLSQVIENEQVNGLPMNGRDWQQLIFLSPGVTPGAPGESGSTDPSDINGQRSKANLFMIDGISIVSGEAHTQSTALSPDAIQEFSIQENLLPAEYGNVAGGVINVQLKSGTNKLHGSLFEYARNNLFDANNYFASEVGGNSLPYRFNQFGGSLGGPILKNKTFFFVDEQTTFTRSTSPVLGIVPTIPERGGDFSNLLDSNGNLIPIYNPVSGWPTRTQYSYMGVENVIPPDDFDSAGHALMNAFPPPTPNFTGSGGINYSGTEEYSQDLYAFDTRIDQSLSEKQKLFAHYSYQQTGTWPGLEWGVNLGDPGLFSGPQFVRSQYLGFGHTYVMRPNIVNEFRFGYQKWRLDLLQPGYGIDLSQQFGIPDSNTASDIWTSGLATIAIDGITQLGGSFSTPTFGRDFVYIFSDNLSWTEGRHTLKGGVEYDRGGTDAYQAIYPRGYYEFGTQMTGGGTNLLNGYDFGGSSLASLLTGWDYVILRDEYTGDNGSQSFGRMRYPRFGIFVQDDYKASKRLTLNLGLRYDILWPYHEVDNRMATYDYVGNDMILPGQGGLNDSLQKIQYWDYAPRIGFAYALTSDRKTVLRSGYGIAYDNMINSPSLGSTLLFNPPFYSNALVYQYPLGYPADTLSTSGVDPVTPGATTLASHVGYKFEPYNNPNAYSQTWDLDIQRGITSSLLAEIAYAGSSGVHLMMPANINAGPPSPSGPTYIYNPNDWQILGLFSAGHSSYHSLQGKLEKRLSHGLFFLASYTWSKSLDNDSNGTDLSDSGGTQPQNEQNWSLERSYSSFDIAHRFVGSFVWKLPFGRGNEFGSNISSLADAVLGKWEISGNVFAQSGNYITVTIPCTWINADPAEDNCRPNVVGNPNSGPHTTLQWFNTAAFSLPDDAFGDARRDIVRGPGFVAFDAGIHKNFQVIGSQEFQFRAELFNAFNHVNFGLPNTDMSSTVFGQITSAGAPRLVQFALRYQF
jgi:hypothetical protein